MIPYYDEDGSEYAEVIETVSCDGTRRVRVTKTDSPSRGKGVLVEDLGPVGDGDDGRQP